MFVVRQNLHLGLSSFLSVAANETGNLLLMTALLYFSDIMACFQEKEDKYLTVFLKRSKQQGSTLSDPMLDVS